MSDYMDEMLRSLDTSDWGRVAESILDDSPLCRFGQGEYAHDYTPRIAESRGGLWRGARRAYLRARRALKGGRDA